MKKLILLITISAFALIWACETPSGRGGCNPPDDDTITVTGPITGGQGMPQSTTILKLATRGYVEEEFFFESTATSYQLEGEMTGDGMWTVEEADKAAFKTRLLVRRPVAPSNFNGTVVVEWFNVSAGADGAPGWMFNMPEILREGYAWVGVSAQKVGVDGGGFSQNVPGAVNLKAYDAERYGSLNHPGDAYSYDIFSIAAKVLQGKGSADVLGGLTPQRLLAYGESQSAFTMITYTNALQPVAKLYDGIFIHSRAAMAVPLEGQGNGGGCGSMSGDNAVKVRTDLDVPVIQFETEGDIRGFYTARQPDTDLIRTWEVAGTAHADAYLGTYFERAEIEDNLPEEVLTCPDANQGPQYIVLRAALHGLDRWVKDGVALPKAEPLNLNDNGQPERDEHGNALGGIRTPHVDVPIATLSPTNNNSGGGGCEGMMCAMFGSTEPFPEEKLLELYPNHEDYVTKFTTSAEATVEARFMLEPEKEAIVAEAQAAPIPTP